MRGFPWDNILVAVDPPAKSSSLFGGSVENTIISTKKLKSKDPFPKSGRLGTSDWPPGARPACCRRAMPAPSSAGPQ